MRLGEPDQPSVRPIGTRADDASRDRRGLLIVLALVLVTVALYSPACHFDFVYYDDRAYVAENPMVLRGLDWSGFLWAFTTGLQANWHPLTWLTHMLDCELFGLDPGAMHATNLLFHTLNSALLFVTLRRLTGTLWRSAFIAALFAWHPLQVQSVAWVSERKNVLSMFFWLLTVWQYSRYVARPTRSRYGLLLLFFALGLMAKPMVVTLPFVLLLFDFWPLNRWPQEAFKSVQSFLATAARFAWEKWPLFLLTVMSCVVTFLVQRAGGAVYKLEHFPLGERFCNAFVSYLWYAEKAFWPAHLCVFYPLEQWPAWQVASAILVLVVCSAVAVWWARRHPWLFVGWFFYLGAMVPTIGIVQVGSQARADRYMYMPGIGLFLLATWAATKWRPAWWPGRWGTAAVAGLVLGGLLTCTVLQLPHWRDGEALMTRALAVTRNNVEAHHTLGLVLLGRDRPAEAEHQFREALRINPRYKYALIGLGGALGAQSKYAAAAKFSAEALKLDPESVDALTLLGCSLACLGKTNEALSHCEKVLRLDSNDPDVMHNLGQAFAALNRLEQAVKCHRKEVELNPFNPEAHFMLGSALARLGQKEEATACYLRAAQLERTNVAALIRLGAALAALGKLDAAEDCYRRALIVRPDDATAHYSLANALARSGRREEAITHYALALRQKPDHLPALQNLGIALGDLGRFDQAVPQFETALKFKPDYPEAHAACGYALVRVGRFADAVTHYEEALRLRPDWVQILDKWARLRATHPSDQLRNGQEAVRLAKRAVELTGSKVAAVLDTLAAAYAEAGRFSDAVETVRKAGQLAREARQTQLAAQLEARVRLYETRQAYRESP